MSQVGIYSPGGDVMALAPQPVGRRERNKQNKLDRITAAAGELFADHGVDEVTTQQIADKADIGTGHLVPLRQDQGRAAPARAELHLRRRPCERQGSRRKHSRRARCGNGDRPSGRGMQPHPDRQRPHLPAGNRLRRPRRAVPPRRSRPHRADRGGDRDGACNATDARHRGRGTRSRTSSPPSCSSAWRPRSTSPAPSTKSSKTSKAKCAFSYRTDHCTARGVSGAGCAPITWSCRPEADTIKGSRPPPCDRAHALVVSTYLTSYTVCRRG